MFRSPSARSPLCLPPLFEHGRFLNLGTHGLCLQDRNRFCILHVLFWESSIFHWLPLWFEQRLRGCLHFALDPGRKASSYRLLASMFLALLLIIKLYFLFHPFSLPWWLPGLPQKQGPVFSRGTEQLRLSDFFWLPPSPGAAHGPALGRGLWRRGGRGVPAAEPGRRGAGHEDAARHGCHAMEETNPSVQVLARTSGKRSGQNLGV